jgi:cytosine/adenosine deaminase-related metal-dependent hydrolase
MENAWTLTARWIVPIDGPPLSRGTLTIEGERIVAVEPRGRRTPDFDFGNVAVLPGFVNAHTHLDLSGMRGKCPPTPDFTQWLRAVILCRRGQSPDQVEADIRSGLAESLTFGTTLLGDIAYHGISWPTLCAASVRSVVYYELLGLPQVRAALAWDAAKTWLDLRGPTDTCRPGLSPHAPYSTRTQLFAAASITGVPVAMHLAETTVELDLLGDWYGPLVPFLRDLGVWDPEGLFASTDEILRLFKGLVPVVVAHGNYLKLDAPIAANTTIVYCPRTHAAFGHSPHPFREFLKRGVRVALGTDSLASNPDLDILAEARFVHRHYPDVPAADVLRMVTLSGAEALGWEAETGSLTPGKSADLVVLPLPDADRADPCTLVLQSANSVSMVLFRGGWTVCDP